MNFFSLFSLPKRLRRLEKAVGVIHDLTLDSMRNASALAHFSGASAWELRVDTSTPRIDAVTREGTIIRPAGNGWMKRNVFDGRPIQHRGRTLAYFCARPSWRNDSHAVVGVAERTEIGWSVHDRPVLYPDIEKVRVDIPSFLVIDDIVYAFYLDNFGPAKSSKGFATDLIVATSEDGFTFSKRRVEAPFKSVRLGEGVAIRYFGLPYFFKNDDGIWVYAPVIGEDRSNHVMEARFDLRSGAVSDMRMSPIDRKTTNIAVCEYKEARYMFYGHTVAGGFYVRRVPGDFALDGKDVMLVDPDDGGWEWDTVKICLSPSHTGERFVECCYMGSEVETVAIGSATIDMERVENALRR